MESQCIGNTDQIYHSKFHHFPKNDIYGERGEERERAREKETDRKRQTERERMRERDRENERENE